MAVVGSARRTGSVVPAIGAALAVSLLAGCGGDDGASTPDTAPVVSPPTTTVAPTEPTEPVETAPPAAPIPLGEIRVTLTAWATAEDPIAVASRPGDDDGVYVAERAGRVVRYDLDGNRTGVVVDLTGRVGSITSEQGLLGLAWDPTGTRLVVDYTDGDAGGATVIERFDLPAGSTTAGDGVELLRVAQPFANHNGGHVAFGPDGMLFIGLGDGGGQGDPGDRAQNPNELLGTLLRIDVTNADTYAIPADNPFAAGGGRREIWLLGVRNPWRFSFDSLTGDLWIGDVGGSEWEEVDVLRAADGGGRGANLGWSLREGLEPTPKYDGNEPAGGFVEPVLVYGHDEGSSITGGVVVRDPRLRELDGTYLYSDFATAPLWALRADGATVTERAELDTGGARLASVVSFGEGPNREVYVVSLGGTIWRLDPG